MAKKISVSELLAELRRLDDELGHSPSLPELDEHGRYSRRPYFDRFESWNAAKAEAGLEPRLEMNISEDDLIEELRRLTFALGRVPTQEEMETLGDYGEWTYRERFGSWPDAVERGLLSLIDDGSVLEGDVDEHGYIRLGEEYADESVRVVVTPIDHTTKD